MSFTKKLAILGTGMMGGALARGLAGSGIVPASEIILYDKETGKSQELARDLGAAQAAALEEAVQAAEIVMIAVKPMIVAAVLEQAAAVIRPDQLVISIAAGVRSSKIEAALPDGIPVIRTMPNTPALIGQGATALCRGTHATDEHMQAARGLFSVVGKTVEVEERLIDAVTGLSGSGPAYVFLMIEALSDGGVKAGLPRDTARLLAAQTVLGAAQLVLESTEHPARLKDNVTTPGGTTIAGLAVLERAGFRAALIDAVEAAANRSKELS
jgi:pyrroline-5-carboxylate reductase